MHQEEVRQGLCEHCNNAQDKATFDKNEKNTHSKVPNSSLPIHLNCVNKPD